jgi:hypothetical protein
MNKALFILLFFCQIAQADYVDILGDEWKYCSPAFVLMCEWCLDEEINQIDRKE